MKEIRNLNPDQAEVKVTKDSRTIEGYAVVFNSESRDLGGFKEVISPEAIEGVLDNADVLALLNHDEARGLLARYTRGKGTLSLSVDSKGVKYMFEAPNTALGNEVLEGITRGDIRTSSFAFQVADGGQEWRKQEDGSFLRTITAFADILDVSPVYREAYEDTSVAKRSLDEARKEETTPEIRGKELDPKPKEEVVETPVEEKVEEPVKPTYDELQAHNSELETKLQTL